MIRHLGNIFDNPQVLKVFNNAENDILCLQRDFGIYVVNCFDTLFAAKLLKYPTLSIAHLVKYHCGLVISSRHQLSDWRKRPLGDDMLAYARSDTCYLLYIYDCLRIDLWKAAGKEGLDSVLEASKKLCLERYEKPFFYPAGFQELFIGANRGQKRNLTLEDYSTTQEAVLTALWNWRDATARKDDESAVYIMSNSELIRISTALPTSLPDLERCSPLSNATRAYNQDILQLIKEQISSHSSKFGLNISINSSNNSLYKSDVRKSKEKPLLSSSFSFTPVVALPDKSKSTEESCARRKSDASPELAPDEVYALLSSFLFLK